MNVLSRRDFLRQVGWLGAQSVLCGTGLAYASPSLAQHETGKTVDGVKAMVFDVFGTLVDWRTCVARESRTILEPMGYKLDWIAFANAWRAEYQPGMEEIRAGRKPFSRLDVVHRGMLDRVRPRFGLESLDETTLRNLNLVWHRLDAWPGVTAGLHRLRRKFMLGPCSNGNISLMVDLARRNEFPWDAILGAEIAGDYKPKPRVYLAAAEALGIEPHECMMVAAHSNDLEAAAKVGLRTGFVAQPDEFGPNTGEATPTLKVDIAATSFQEFALRMVP
ncbi:MAG: haloacid dehalogenase type II [Oxalobacteraceae bacterium]|nr:haloacid dehalogenase type II [Oxalobacteraceae bacterium]